MNKSKPLRPPVLRISSDAEIVVCLPMRVVWLYGKAQGNNVVKASRYAKTLGCDLKVVYPKG